MLISRDFGARVHLNPVPNFIARSQVRDPGKPQKIEDSNKLGQVRYAETQYEAVFTVSLRF